jgi:hypothetical protein
MVVELRTVGLICVGTRNDRTITPREFPAKQEFQPDNICAHEELREMLMNAMKTLPERYQKVVVLYYTNDLTMKEIGGLLGINEAVSRRFIRLRSKMAVVLQLPESTPAGRSKAFSIRNEPEIDWPAVAAALYWTHHVETLTLAAAPCGHLACGFACMLALITAMGRKSAFTYLWVTFIRVSQWPYYR